MFCKCMAIGYVTKKVDTLPTNANVVTFDISYQSTKKGSDGRYDWNFIECMAFDRTAQNALSYLKQGDKVFVEGILNIQQYVDKQGFTRNSTTLLVGMFRILDSKEARESKAGRDSANSSNGVNGGYSVTNINDSSTISGRDKASNEEIDELDDEIPFKKKGGG